MRLAPKSALSPEDLRFLDTVFVFLLLVPPSSMRNLSDNSRTTASVTASQIVFVEKCQNLGTTTSFIDIICGERLTRGFNFEFWLSFFEKFKNFS